MTSGEGGEASSVRVLPGLTNDLAARLQLGTLNGGVETDAVARIRPKAIPPAGILTSGTFTDLNMIPSASSNSFRINLNGYGFDTVNLGNTAGNPRWRAKDSVYLDRSRKWHSQSPRRELYPGLSSVWFSELGGANLTRSRPDWLGMEIHSHS